MTGIAIGGFAYVQGLNFANNIADRVSNVEKKMQSVDGLVTSLNSLSTTVSSLSSTVSSLSSSGSSSTTYVTNICTTVSYFPIVWKFQDYSIIQNFGDSRSSKTAVFAIFNHEISVY